MLSEVLFNAHALLKLCLRNLNKQTRKHRYIPINVTDVVPISQSNFPTYHSVSHMKLRSAIPCPSRLCLYCFLIQFCSIPFYLFLISPWHHWIQHMNTHTHACIDTQTNVNGKAHNHTYTQEDVCLTFLFTHTTLNTAL